MNTPLPREFVYVTPRGKAVRIRTSSAQVGDGLDAVDAHRRLSVMLEAKAGGRDLEDFLLQTCNIVFPNADFVTASPRVKVGNGHVPMEVDLAYRLRGTPDQVGIVEVRGMGNMSMNLRRQIQQVHAIVDFWNSNQRAKIVEAYLVTGRGVVPNIPQPPHFSMNVITWDDIVGRLTGSGGVDQEAHETIVVVHLLDSCRSLMREIVDHPEILDCIHDRRFEEVVAALLHDLGYSYVELTPPRNDGGRDIILGHHNRTTGSLEVYYVELKHWVSGDKVTLRLAAHLEDVVNAHRVTGGMLLSSSGFGPRLLQQEVEFRRRGIHLRDQRDLIDWARGWRRIYGNPIYEPFDIFADREP